MALTSDIRNNDQIRIYDRTDSIVFLKTKEAFGGLSNMAGGFPLCVNGIPIRTSEALYQACRFPHLPEVQRLIIEQRSPMTAKMKSRKHHQDSRTDWDWVRVKIMRWCLRVKLIQNWNAFSELLIETGDQSIVEQSRKDDFWGAKPIDTPTLVGVNALGRLLMELREEVKTEGQEAFLQIEPLDISDFSLGGRPIEPVTAPDLSVVTSEPLSYPLQPLLFEPSVVKESPPSEYTVESSKNTGIAKFKPYPAYKDSGVDWIGEIPAHWKMQTIRSVTELKSEKNQPDLPVLSVYREYGVIPKDSRNDNHNATSLDTSNYKVVNVDDLVINKMKAWQGSMGVSTHHGIVSPAYIICRINTKKVISGFLHYLLRSKLYIGVYNSLSYGVRIGQWDMHYEDFKKILIPLPEAKEQKRIVHFLDQKTAEIDEAIKKKQRLIEMLKELKQITIAEAVTKGLNPNVPMRDSGVEGLGEVPMHWEVLRLKWLSHSVLTGRTPEKEAFEEGYIDWFTPGDFKDEIVLKNAEKQIAPEKVTKGLQLFPPNTVLLVGIGATLGKVGVIKTKSAANQQVNGVIPNSKVTPTYLTFSLLAQNAFMKKISNISAINIMNQDKTKQIPLAVPPLEVQKKIAVFLDQTTTEIDEAIDKKQRLIELLKELKQTTIAEAVTGKIKV